MLFLLNSFNKFWLANRKVFLLLLIAAFIGCSEPINTNDESPDTFDESQKTGEVFVIDTTLKNKKSKP